MGRAFTIPLLALLIWSPGRGHTAGFRLVLDLGSPPEAGGNGFGSSVAGLENRIVAATDADCGGAFVYDAATGVLVRSLGGLPCEGGSFGEVVAAGAGRIAVAARFTQRVYVFDADGRPERVLSAPDLAPDDYGFGTSLAIAERLVIVGGARTGVYVFDATTGDIRERISPPTAGPEGFGAAVAFSAGHVIVGDPQETTVYGDVWRRVVPNRRERAFGFGRALAADASASRVAVGGAEDAGGREVVFILDATTGAVQRRYRAPRPGDFGAALALQGRLLLVGAPDTQEETGAAYLYRLGRGRPVAVFRLGGIYRFTGQSVAFSGDRVVVGSPDRGRVGAFAR
jgi:outer membrane protein assembly factor BamB